MPNQQPAQFDIANVRVTYVLTVPQVDLILKGINSLSVGEAADFRNQFLAHAQSTVQKAKQDADAAVAASEAAANPAPAAAPAEAAQ